MKQDTNVAQKKRRKKRNKN